MTFERFPTQGTIQPVGTSTNGSSHREPRDLWITSEAPNNGSRNTPEWFPPHGNPPVSTPVEITTTNPTTLLTREPKPDSTNPKLHTTKATS